MLLEKAQFDSNDKRPVKLEGNPAAPKFIALDTLGRFDIVKSRLY